MVHTSSSRLAPARILVFIPCYNCAPQVTRTLSQLTPEVLAQVDGVLVVDNRSTDTTVEAATAALAKIDGVPAVLVQNRENYHLGGSHKVAFRYAAQHGFTHVCILHGDDQGRIADLLHVLPLVKRQPEMTWLGSRFMLGSRLKGYGILRIIGNLGFNALFSLGTRRWLTDLGSGLNIFSLQGLAPIEMDRFGDNLMFNYYLILAICFYGVPFRYVPISWREDDQVSNVKLVEHGKATLKLLADYVQNPARFVTAEHRAKPKADYAWDVLFDGTAPKTTSRKKVA